VPTPSWSAGPAPPVWPQLSGQRLLHACGRSLTGSGARTRRRGHMRQLPAPPPLLLHLLHLLLLLTAGPGLQRADAAGDSTDDADLDAYGVLGLVPGQVDDRSVKKSYRALSLRWHPDKCGGALPQAEPEPERCQAEFVRVARAYDLLRDAPSRAAYDLRRRQAGAGRAAAFSRSHSDRPLNRHSVHRVGKHASFRIEVRLGV
jgi:hypothetical protein